MLYEVITPILELAADLASGRATSRRLVEEALARIEEPNGEGSRVFLTVHAEAARAAAEASDSLRAVGIVPSLIAGLPRITSYNVCYTKLLRFSVTLPSKRPSA